ncbi:hypothetical protein JTB14_036516 [Gonioctena quinquepunctata]|nr:hypothetical protein JTB14_036516 [Gonioctena quinquepunctata]
MDAGENADGVFNLITSLCEKFHNEPHKIKSSRTKCYEILLGKRISTHKKRFQDFKGTTDPHCNLLCWQFTLAQEYNLIDHAETLQKWIENFSSSIDDFKNIVTFLFSLRNLPQKNKKILDLSSLPSLNEFENFSNLFKLPQFYFNESENPIDKRSTVLTSTPKDLSGKDSVHSKLFPEFPEILKDEGYDSPSKCTDENIWELASKLKYCDRRNWESFGYPEPDKERPFLSELGELSSLWVENLESLYMFKLFRDGTVFSSRMVSRKGFIRDLKFLLVGMASESFNFDGDGQFYLVPGVNVDGIAPDTLNSYCRDILFCGTCYKALNRMSTPNPDTGKYKYLGFIFIEFCESINRYLKFYQTATFNIPDSMNFLEFHEKTHQLQMQISTLASICKVGPYMRMEEIPHGVALLNYLYQKVLSLTNQKIISVLYSILYPCCQVYFSRFLKRWILEGIIDDPYGEFFIKPDSKYIISRGRTYWTRSYSVKEDIVPDFLVDLKMDILLCGKSMSLLKFCEHSSKLRLYLMGKKPHIISCCLTLDQLANLQQNTTNYYLDVHEECGPRFSLKEVLLQSHYIDRALMGLIAKKRATTLKKLDLERQKMIMEQTEKKIEEMNMLKEQYDAALEQKQLRISKEIQEEIKQVEENLETERKRQKLVQEEANIMIDYYSKLFEISENRKSKIESHVKKVKSILTEQNLLAEDKECSKSTEAPGDKSNSSTDSFYSLPEDAGKNADKVEVENMEIENDPPEMKSSESLDIINANADIPERSNEVSNKNANPDQLCNIQAAINNFEMARKIKQKIMTEEMDINYGPRKEITPSIPTVTHLSEAQKNKLKMLSTEFGMDFKTDPEKINKTSNIIVCNRNRVLGSSDCFAEMYLDNENFVNRNLRNKEDDNNIKTTVIKKSKSLMLDFDKVNVNSMKETDKQIPMSVDSTPMSELPQSIGTPSTMFLSIDTNQIESIPTTAETQQTDEGFKFDQVREQPIDPIYYNRKENSIQKTVFSKRVTKKQAMGVSTNCLRLFLHECVQIPLMTQTKLVNDELLRYFINDLHYLEHLASLRDYFFLQDGEFGRNITNNLFTKLYDAHLPAELINYYILQDLVFGALDMSCKNQENSQCLSFKVNSLPKCFDLGNPDVLDCLSLTYKVKWPLNILLPTDTIAKYDEVFKFILKLNRVSWVLKKTFLELKVLAKETGKKEIYLMSSPQYRKLHQCRHVMTQFVQTLQNYVVGEVLQSSWALFEKNLENVTSIDELYSAHTAYIKNILFMCLLNQKTVILRNVIHKTFMVILKFFDYLRSRSWICENGSYIHPNFDKLESIFKNFQEFVLYLFKVGRKVAKCGYQPHLLLLLEMLDINEYFSESLKHSSS